MITITIYYTCSKQINQTEFFIIYVSCTSVLFGVPCAYLYVKSYELHNRGLNRESLNREGLNSEGCELGKFSPFSHEFHFS